MRGVLAVDPMSGCCARSAGCMGRTTPRLPWYGHYARPPPRSRWPMPTRRRRALTRAYHLDTGDKLRVVVYGQEGLTNTYAIDASGSITMPLIGSVPARGSTPAGLAADIAAKLRNGFIREPSVAVEVEAYRPFFILGEVAAPGQYPYVPNMTVESAVAIAGGFSPRALRDRVTVTHTDGSGTARYRGAAGNVHQPGRYGARRRTLVLIMPVVDGQPLRILHATRAPVGGIFRHILDLANGQADQRPSRRHHRRQPHRRRARRAGAGGNRAPPQARRSSRRHPPRAVPQRRPGMGAFPAPGPEPETGRAARPWRQGRCLHSR